MRNNVVITRKEPTFVWSPLMLFNRFATKEYLEQRRVGRLLKKAVKDVSEKKKRLQEQVLQRRSKQYYLRVMERKSVRFQKYRLRNFKLLKRWKDALQVAGLSEEICLAGKLVRQWRLTFTRTRAYVKTLQLLQDKYRTKCIRRWFQYIENLGQTQFVMIHRKSSEDFEKLLKLFKVGSEMVPVADRYISTTDKTELNKILEYLLAHDWYLGVLLPPKTPRDQGKCLIRNMTTFKIEEVPENKLISAKMLPKMSSKKRMMMKEQRAMRYRKRFQRSLDFVLAYDNQGIDLRLLRKFVNARKEKRSKRKIVITLLQCLSISTVVIFGLCFSYVIVETFEHLAIKILDNLLKLFSLFFVPYQ
ncbi:Protein CBG28034 [Caenorhabditis briggsae]|uniref:Protein CBG28034 n=1 Tax=Caenorhabditis briggsae TaxID=6238 RepID=B6IG30_CAEBR|nr:Protein CBG28034 [Caenorhabditis briggsae]CAR98860.1 Protein CBG28034 [Caenorhabditis briggsae]